MNGSPVTLGNVRQFNYDKDGLHSCRQDARYTAEVSEAATYALAMGALEAPSASAVDLKSFSDAYSANFRTQHDMSFGGPDAGTGCYGDDSQRCQDCEIAEITGDLQPGFCLS